MGTQYTREFLQNAEHDLEQVRDQFLVPLIEERFTWFRRSRLWQMWSALPEQRGKSGL